MSGADVTRLPPGLPAPADDGACDHLPGLPVPDVALPSSDGGTLSLVGGDAPRTVVFVYPGMGRPGEEPPGGYDAWDAIPGARGCTPQACSFRDAAAEFRELGVRVVGLSTQTAEEQREAAERLHLAYPLLSDAGLEIARALALPTFEHAGDTYLRRATLILRDGVVEHVLYPVFPPDESAETTLAWLRAHP
jgi:peroxiredoxin